MEFESDVKLGLELSERHKMLKRHAGDFAKKEIAPILAQADREDKVPEGLLKKISDAGLLGIAIPPEYGGPGEDYVGVVIVDEELTRYGGELGHSLTCMHNLTVSDTIYLFGTEEQRKRWLPRMLTNEKTGAGLYSEPNAGSDLLAMQMKATRDGDSYLLNGTKNFSSGLDFANTPITFARTKPEAGAKGITAFILDLDENKVGLQLEKRDKMGSRGVGEFEAHFDNYRVPAKNVLGNENDGVTVMMTAIGKQRPLAAASCIGHIWMALDACVPYAKERTTFGKPIASYQLIQTMLVDMYTMGLASRYMVHQAMVMAWELYHVRGGKDRALMRDVNRLGSAAKLISCRASRKAVLDAYQIHGGNAYCLDHPVNQILRDGLVGSQAGGTDEMMILNIADNLLKE